MSKGFGGWRSFDPIYVAEVDHYGQRVLNANVGRAIIRAGDYIEN